MKAKIEAEKAIENAVKVANTIPDDLTDAEKSYLHGIIDGMNALRAIRKDKPEKTA